ncbi:hypothetical protein [Pararhizobium mangrovi]|nr:hypothetical protein [Pararhizobium mangrovi]
MPEPGKPAHRAAQLENEARATWLFAGDCARWGLGYEAARARAEARQLRVRAIMARAGATMESDERNERG